MNAGITERPLRIGIACYPTHGGSGDLNALDQALVRQLSSAMDVAVTETSQSTVMELTIA